MRISIPTEYTTFVRARLDAGDDPNDIVDAIEDALEIVATDWALWANGKWSLDTVCRVCGSSVAGVCGHRERAGEPILRREYKAVK